VTGRNRALVVGWVVAAGLLVTGIALGWICGAEFRDYVQHGPHGASCTPYPGRPGSTNRLAWDAVWCATAGAVVAAAGLWADRRPAPLVATITLVVLCLVAVAENGALAHAIATCAVYAQKVTIHLG
jgi:hypothetical protein